MLKPEDVTACLVTRGDQPDMMQKIIESLIFPRVIVYDNSAEDDVKTFGRYRAISRATSDVIYTQDDDVVVPRATQEALLRAYEPGVPTASYGHTATPGGYDDCILLHGGAVIDQHMPALALGRYLGHHPDDDTFLYYCDFAAGMLYPRFKHVHLPFYIAMAVAQHPSRMCNQTFAAGMKAEVARRCREILQREVVAA